MQLWNPKCKLDFPTLGVNGNLVKLRKFAYGDITSNYISWLSDPHVVKFSNQRFRIHNEKSCKEYLASFSKTNNLFLVIENRYECHTIGTMTMYISVEHGTADMGIMIGDRTVWGQGFGQEAWSIALKWLIDVVGIRKVTAGCMKCNIGMIRLMQRSEMQHEATLKNHELLNGSPQDLVYYSKFGI
jgi:ribosomal-protein-alanine N-acetyltransferase